MRFLYIIECMLRGFSQALNNRVSSNLTTTGAAETFIEFWVGFLGFGIICGIIFIIGYNIGRGKKAKIVTIVGLIICVAFLIAQIILVEVRFHQLGL